MDDPLPNLPSDSDTPVAPPAGTRFTRPEQGFLFCGLMLVTGLFLPWQINGTETTPWNLFTTFGSPTATLGWVGLVVLYGLTLGSVTRPTLRPWFGLATALAVNAATTVVGFPDGAHAYGAELSRGFAFGLLVLSANPVIVKAGDLAMRRLNSRSVEVFTHWGTALPGVQFSAREFYAKVEAAIRARRWPGVELVRVTHREAGPLSHQREYLRVVRQRQVFDLCAATFGRDYFFTLREAEIPAPLTLSTLLILLLTLALSLRVGVSLGGWIAGPIGLATLLLFGGLVLLNVLRMGLTRLDGLLLRTPVLGPVYETWFRRGGTYFQHDTRMVFLKLMDGLVKELVDAETSAKGIELLSCFEHQPILDGLYKVTTHRPGDRGKTGHGPA